MGAPEARVEPRLNLKWKIALAVDQDGTMRLFQGKTEDLSLTGAAVHLDHNFTAGNLINALLLLPAITSASESVVVEMQARIVYAVLSSSASHFRIGLQFVKFKNDGQKILANRLAIYAQGQVKK